MFNVSWGGGLGLGLGLGGVGGEGLGLRVWGVGVVVEGRVWCRVWGEGLRGWVGGRGGVDV